MSVQHFFSHGKLLITAEYFVLDGAKALALPTKRGQELWADEFDDKAALIYWKTYREEKLWLVMVFNYQTGELVETNNSKAARFILRLFAILKQLNSPMLQSKHSYKLESNIEFPENYGLGSSSTLIHNLATWAHIDPFILNERGLGGSGYDIAVAKMECPIFYTKERDQRKIEKVDFNPPFRDSLIFIHLNKKQDSREGINTFRKLPKNQQLIQRVTAITDQIVQAADLQTFSKLLTEHERLIASHFKIPTVREKYFADAPTFVKSLGAWGGDFVMASTFEGYEDYFHQKGFSVILPYRDVIL